MTTSTKKHRESMIWQRRFWEHQIRDEKDFNHPMDYIHYNPVKHGISRRVADWPYSTVHSYVKNGIYPSNWGGNGIEFVDIGEYPRGQKARDGRQKHEKSLWCAFCPPY